MVVLARCTNRIMHRSFMSIRTEPENRTHRREITRFPGEVHLPEIPESQNKYAEKIGQTSRFSAEVKCAGWSEELID